MIEVAEVPGIPWETLPSSNIASKSFRGTKIILTEEVLHVPQNMDGSELASQILKPLNGALTNHDKLLDQEILTHYCINPALLSEINKAFQNPGFIHISSLLADYFYRTNQDKVFVFTSSQRMHILITNKDGLRFYNNYAFAAPEDFLYWIMVVLESHGLDPKIVPLVLGGRIGKDGPITDLLDNYLGDISFAESLTWQVPDGIENHLYLDLYLAQT